MRISKTLFPVGFTVSVGFATAVPSNTGLIQERDDGCADGPGWALPVYTIGGSGGTYNCETSYGHDYSPVSGMEVWRKGDNDGDRISGTRVTLPLFSSFLPPLTRHRSEVNIVSGDFLAVSDPLLPFSGLLILHSASGVTSEIYGQEDTSKYPSTSLKLGPGELITSAILYGNGDGEWLGHIHIETTKQTFDAGRDTNGINPYGINVGGGLLYGAQIVTSPDGDNGDSVQSLAWLFLAQPVDRIAITDITYDTPPQGTSNGITPQNVVVGTWYNDADSNVGYSLSPTYTVTESYT